MSTPDFSLLASRTVAFALVAAALTTSACGDDTAGGGGSGGGDAPTSSATTAASTGSSASSTSSASGASITSTGDGVGGGSSSSGGVGGAGGEDASQSSAGGEPSGGGGLGGGEAGNGGAGDAGQGGSGGATGEGGAGGGAGEGGGGGESSACLEISGDDFALLTSGGGVFSYRGESTVGFDGPDPDMLALDLFGEDLTGVIDLGFSTGQSPQTCEACLWVYADYADQTTQRAFFVDRGTLDLGESHPPYIEGSFTDVTLVEVEIDFDIADFVPVEGGMCLHVESMAFDVER